MRQSAWRLVASGVLVDPEPHLGGEGVLAGDLGGDRVVADLVERGDQVDVVDVDRVVVDAVEGRVHEDVAASRSRRRTRTSSASGSIGHDVGHGRPLEALLLESERPEVLEVLEQRRHELGQREVAAALEVLLVGEGHLDDHQVAGRRAASG